MKFLTTMIACAGLMASIPAANAFTFDFSAAALGPIPVTVNVLGYGPVTFTLLSGESQIGERYGVKTLEMAAGSAIRVEFPTPVTEAAFTFIDLDSNDRAEQTSLTGDQIAVQNGVNRSIVDLNANNDTTRVLGPVDSTVVPSEGLNAVVITLSQPIGGDYGAGIKQVSFDAVPEPSSVALVGLAGLGLALRRRRVA